jgi:glycosyltransferase involved in cell wall biosynthesis
MKICVLTSSYPINSKDASVGFFARDFVSILAQYGHEVVVLTQLRNGLIEDDKEYKTIRYKWLGGNTPLSVLKIWKPRDFVYTISFFYQGYKSLKSILAKENIDHIFALWAVPSGFLALLAKRKFNVNYSIWCLGSDIWFYGRNILTKGIVKKILKSSTYNYADGIGLCDEVTNLSRKYCCFLPTSRILNQPNELTVNVSEKKEFVFIGRYHPNKGPDVLLKAISLLDSKIARQSIFHFYGGGEMENDMKKFVAENGLTNTFIHGYIDITDIVTCLRQAHYLIIPSRYDSIPVIFSDSLQCQLPIIATDVGDTGDLIKKYNIGFVCEKENANELAKLIEKSFYIEKSEFIENINEALKIFDVKKTVQKLISDLKIN